jgi:hypothetical protein
MRTDPSDTGGLFVGRRPGTAPLRFRKLPERGSEARQRVDGSLAGVLFAAMTVLSLLCWGPIPIACLWIGAQVNYLSGSISLGILSAFVGLFVLLFGALKIMRSLDEAWILVRRAAGFDQRSGVLGRVFAATAAVCALGFTIWFVLFNGTGSMVTSGNGTAWHSVPMADVHTLVGAVRGGV